MRIILDTNVFISGIFWNTAPHDIITLIEKGEIEVYTTNKILDELFGVLQRPKFDYLFDEALITRNLVFQKILGLVKICIPTDKDKNIDITLTDPKDKMFLVCALACQAQYLVSGDQHLLKLKEFQNIPILTPRQFLNRINMI